MSNKSITRRTYWITIAGFIVTIFALAGTYLGVLRDATNYTFTSSQSIEIEQRSGTNLPWCTSISGSAALNEDKKLWMAVRDTDGDNFYLRRITQVEGSDKWDSGKFRVGEEEADAGHLFEIYVFYIANDASELLTNLDAIANDGSGKGTWFVHGLPSSVESAEPFRATRSQTDRGIPEGSDCP